MSDPTTAITPEKYIYEDISVKTDEWILLKLVL